MSETVAKIKAREAARSITLTVVVINPAWNRLAMFIGLRLIKLGCRLANIGFVIDEDGDR